MSVSDLRPRKGHDHSTQPCHFQICQSCFWCASTLYENRLIEKCPACFGKRIDSLPVSANEKYSYGLSGPAGVSLSFSGG
jgi:hypothetical protein